MKRYIVLFATLFAVIFSATAQTAEEATTEPAQQEVTATDHNTLWDSANAAYNEGNYSKAVELYEAILADGEHSAKLYYNLGNAYYKQEKLGKAILNYTRALRLAPADEDIRHNLEYATEATKDNIEEIPEMYLKGLTFHYVKDIKEVLEIALLDEKIKNALNIQ